MKIILILSLLTTFNLFAVDIEFVGPCDSQPFLAKNMPQVNTLSIGELTVKVLEESKIPFTGGDYGIIQISNSPIGDAAIEILGSEEMLAYGWCYEIDGVLQEIYPNEISVNDAKKIRWFYGYAHYRSGHWIAQCLESNIRKAPAICSRI